MTEKVKVVLWNSRVGRGPMETYILVGESSTFGEVLDLVRKYPCPSRPDRAEIVIEYPEADVDGQ